MAFTIVPTPKLKREDMIVFLTTLSWMLSSGLSVKAGIDVLLEDPNVKMNKKVLDIVSEELDEGKHLSEIFRDHEESFGQGKWRQLNAAERTGKVPECLLRLAEQIKSDSSLLNKIKGAVAYPAFILVFAMIAGYYMFTTIIPQIGEMMQEFDVELPAMTVMMMNISEALVNNLFLITVVLVGLIVGIRWLLKKPLQLQWHKVITKMPYVGSVSVNMNYSLVYILLNDMIANGAHVVEALRVASSAATNRFIQRELENAAGDMEREGYTITEALIRSTTMPSNDKSMLQVGSITGRTMELLTDLASRRKEAAHESVEALMRIMPSIVLIIVAGLVGVMVIAIYMPMITMTGQIG